MKVWTDTERILHMIYNMIFFYLQKNGKRAKLVTADGNQIDTMFIDRRNTLGEPQNDTLVSILFLMSLP